MKTLIKKYSIELKYNTIDYMPAGKLFELKDSGSIRRVKTMTARPSTKRRRTLRKVVSAATVRQPSGVGKIRSALPFANRYPFKMQFINNFVMTTSATRALFGAQADFDLNNLNRPSPVLTTHAALGFNEIANIYLKYKIFGCAIELTINDPETDGYVVAIMLRASQNPETLVGKTIELAIEKQNVTVKRVNNTGSQITKYKAYWPINKLEGLTKLQFDANSRDYTSLFTTTGGPLNKPRLSFAASNGNAAVAIEARVTCRLTFYGVAYDRKNLALSNPGA